MGSNAADIAITPDGTTAYVTAVGAGNVTPIDLATGVPGTPIVIAANADGIAMAPDGKTAYVASFNSVVTPIDTTTNTTETPITAGSKTAGIVVTPDQAPLARFTVDGSALGLSTSFDASASTVAYGLGEIAFNAVGPALVADLAPVHLRGRYNGVFGTSFGAAALVAPIVGTVVLQHLGEGWLWGSCLVVSAASGGAVLLLGARIDARRASMVTAAKAS